MEEDCEPFQILEQTLAEQFVVPGPSLNAKLNEDATGTRKKLNGDTKTLRDNQTECSDDSTLTVSIGLEHDAGNQQLSATSTDTPTAKLEHIIDANVAKVVSEVCLQTKGGGKNRCKPKDALQESTDTNSIIGCGIDKEGDVDDSTERRLEVKVVPLKFTRPTYSQEEREFLYADKKFVINIDDVEEPTDQIGIWQILLSKQCLLQYYPCKHGGEQYYQTGVRTWHFTKEDFLSEEFYEKFQPIIVIVANTRDLGPPAPTWPNTITELTTVQYVFLDKFFFNRMIKYIYKIQHIDTAQIRQAFMSALKALTLSVFHPDFLTATFGNPEYENGKHSWLFLRQMTNTLVESVSSYYAEEAFAQTKKNPALCFNYELRKSDKTIPCMACLNRNQPRDACIKVSFDGTVVGKVPYNPDTFLDTADQDNFKFPQDVLWCKHCSRNLKKIHKMAHFWYNLWRLIKQNVCKDIQNFHEMNAPITDDVIVWIQSNFISWKNVMFADFQLTYAEVEDLKSSLAVGTPQQNPNAPLPQPVPSFGSV